MRNTDWYDKVEKAVMLNRTYFDANKIRRRESYRFWKKTLMNFVNETNITNIKHLKNIFHLSWECIDYYRPFRGYINSLLNLESQIQVLKDFNKQGRALWIDEPERFWWISSLCL